MMTVSIGAVFTAQPTRERSNEPVLNLESKEECSTRNSPIRQHFLTLRTMRSVNKVVLVGHLAADPEMFQTRTGKARVTFPIATHRDTTSDGVKKKVTDYHRVVAWGMLGESCQIYLTKGQGVCVEGTILNRAYEKDGERKFVTEVLADEVNMLTWKKRSGVSTIGIDPVHVE